MHTEPPLLLLVTENGSVKSWFKNQLNERYNLITADNRNRALTEALVSSLDFIIVDSQLEDTNPIDLCRELRNVNTTVPLILITGRLKKQYRKEAAKAGVTDFLNTDLNAEELQTRLAQGKKATQIRHKIGGLSSSIPIPKIDPSHDYLKNKIILTDEVVLLLAQAKKEKKPLPILVIALDQFPEIEKKKGAAYGGMVLDQLKGRIKPFLPSASALILAPEGQIIVFLTLARPEEAHVTAKELQHHIEEEPFVIAEEPLHLTVSIALNLLEGTEIDFYQVIQEAGKYLKRSASTTNKIISLYKDFP